MILLDSNVLSALMQPTPEPRVVSWLDLQARQSLWTTTVNVFEIRFGLKSMPTGGRQSILTENFELILGQLEERVAAFDLASAQEASELMAARIKRGRVVDIRDTMIAGIALANNASLATRNIKDFEDARIPLVDPWST